MKVDGRRKMEEGRGGILFNYYLQVFEDGKMIFYVSDLIFKLIIWWFEKKSIPLRKIT